MAAGVFGVQLDYSCRLKSVSATAEKRVNKGGLIWGRLFVIHKVNTYHTSIIYTSIVKRQAQIWGKRHKPQGKVKSKEK